VLGVLKSRGVDYTDWAGWLRLNQHELSLGASFTGPIERERVKVVDRAEQARIAHATDI
jgi:ferredoxin--NADP+ reductase